MSAHPLDTAPLDRILWIAHRGFLVDADIRRHDGGSVIDLRRHFADLPASSCCLPSALQALPKSPAMTDTMRQRLPDRRGNASGPLGVALDMLAVEAATPDALRDSAP